MPMDLGANYVTGREVCQINICRAATIVAAEEIRRAGKRVFKNVPVVGTTNRMQQSLLFIKDRDRRRIIG
jgi:hypothetical protein